MTDDTLDDTQPPARVPLELRSLFARCSPRSQHEILAYLRRRLKEDEPLLRHHSREEK